MAWPSHGPISYVVGGCSRFRCVAPLDCARTWRRLGRTAASGVASASAPPSTSTAIRGAVPTSASTCRRRTDLFLRLGKVDTRLLPDCRIRHARPRHQCRWHTADLSAVRQSLSRGMRCERGCVPSSAPTNTRGGVVVTTPDGRQISDPEKGRPPGRDAVPGVPCERSPPYGGSPGVFSVVT